MVPALSAAAPSARRRGSGSSTCRTACTCRISIPTGRRHGLRDHAGAQAARAAARARRRGQRPEQHAGARQRSGRRRAHPQPRRVAERRAARSAPRAPTSPAPRPSISTPPTSSAPTRRCGRSSSTLESNLPGRQLRGRLQLRVPELHVAGGRPNTPLPHERDPRVVFQRMFGDGGTRAARLRADADRTAASSIR